LILRPDAIDRQIIASGAKDRSGTLQCGMRIAVFNQKGGVGKTTTVLNLAAASVRDGGQPLVLDLDPQCHLSAIHGPGHHDSAHSLFGFYQGTCALDELAIPWQGIGRLIPSHPQLIKVDSVFGKGPAILNKLRLGLESIDESAPGYAAQATFIDCCPYVGVLALNAIFACDLLLIPVSTDYLSLQAAQQMTRTLAILEPVLKRRVERRYLLTRYDRRRKMSQDIQEQLRGRYGQEVCLTVISENVAIAESPSKNRDVFSHAATSIGAKDYTALYEELRQNRLL
jgi:chromosome partitioning protein